MELKGEHGWGMESLRDKAIRPSPRPSAGARNTVCTDGGEDSGRVAGGQVKHIQQTAHGGGFQRLGLSGFMRTKGLRVLGTLEGESGCVI